MYDHVGTAQLTVGYTFLGEALSNEAVESSVIGLRDFLKIKLIRVDEEGQSVTFQCDVYQHLLN